jgi:hypothetical protein
MKDRIAHVWSPHTAPNGETRWPDKPEVRNELASRLLGACTVAEIDGAMGLAMDLLHNPVPSAERLRSRPHPEVEDQQRRVFASFTSEQRTHVEDLLFSTVHLAIFGLLTKLDQFPGGTVDLTVRDPDSGQGLASIVDGSVLDLHDRLASWLDEFSEYPEHFSGSARGGRTTRCS